MAIGIAGYFIYTAIPALDSTHAWLLRTVEVVQPVLIFLMLFITFCKVKMRELRWSRWHAYALLMQISLFVLCTLLAHQCSMFNCQSSMVNGQWSILAQCAMLCFICPTATAAAVVTAKLGGNVGSLTTYTIFINLVAALLIPLVLPILNSQSLILNAQCSIFLRLFPLLIGPLLLALLLRWMWPRLTAKIASVAGMAFYIWAVSLTLAIAMSVKALVHSRASAALLIGIAVVSAVACAVQFAFGHYVGKAHGDKVSATQSCGQKNTVFAIWLGYTFLNPLTALAGGFYSIWHNVYNSWQLKKRTQQINRE